jgi:hypothetical protein
MTDLPIEEAPPFSTGLEACAGEETLGRGGEAGTAGPIRCHATGA